MRGSGAAMPHRVHPLVGSLLALLAMAPALPGADPTAQDFARQGLELMRQSDTDRTRIVDAALAFARALDGFEKAKDEENSASMKASIFWCKKRMSGDDIKAFLAAKKKTEGKDAPAVEAEQKQTEMLLAKVDQVADTKVDAGQAEAYFQRAEAFAKAHPDDALQVAIRWFEVADRFKDSDFGRKAQDLSLKAMTTYSKQPGPEAARRETLFTRRLPVAGKQAPRPDPAEAAEAVAELKKTYVDDYRRATGIPERAALAKRLLDKGRETKDDLLGRWVLLNEALRLGMDGDAYHVVVMAADELGQSFEGVDPHKLKRETFPRMPSTVSKAMIALLDNPEDKDANLAAGTYFLLRGQNLALGLPCLVRGSDAGLARLADQELSGAETAAQQAELGDAWYELAKRQAKNPVEREFAFGRSRTWYQGAMAKGLSGFSLDKARSRCEEVDEQFPPPPSDWSKISAKQWDRLPGQVVNARAAINSQELGKVGAKQKVRVVPHPTETWAIFSGGVNTPSTWRGAQAPKQIGGGSGFGRMLLYADGRPIQPNAVVEGPCKLEVQLETLGKRSSNSVTPSGQIRVKLVPE